MVALELGRLPSVLIIIVVFLMLIGKKSFSLPQCLSLMQSNNPAANTNAAIAKQAKQNKKNP